MGQVDRGSKGVEEVVLGENVWFEEKGGVTVELINVYKILKVCTYIYKT
jgi:hypothetical protein